MKNRLAGLATLIALLAGCATPRPHWQDPSLDSISRDSLVRFESREEFDAYLDELYKAADDYDMWWVIWFYPKYGRAPQRTPTSRILAALPRRPRR